MKSICNTFLEIVLSEFFEVFKITLQKHGAQFTQIQLHCNYLKNEYLIAIKYNCNVFDPNSGTDGNVVAFSGPFGKFESLLPHEEEFSGMLSALLCSFQLEQTTLPQLIPFVSY